MQMEHAAPQRASLVATVPLTDAEDWRRFERGEIRVFHDGEELPL
jgi:predicted glutamine amidotransferase